MNVYGSVREAMILVDAEFSSSATSGSPSKKQSVTESGQWRLPPDKMALVHEKKAEIEKVCLKETPAYKKMTIHFVISYLLGLYLVWPNVCVFFLWWLHKFIRVQLMRVIDDNDDVLDAKANSC